jgi:hypothetical protein
MRRRRRSSAGAVTHEATKPEAPDPKPPSDGERKKLVLSLRMRDVTHRHSGKVFAIIGAPPPRRKL